MQLTSVERRYVELCLEYAAKGEYFDLDPVLFAAFSVGGCEPRRKDGGCAYPRRESRRGAGANWGESCWGSKMDRNATKVALCNERAMSESDRDKLVAYRRRLYLETGSAIVGRLDTADDMLSINENWQVILDNA